MNNVSMYRRGDGLQQLYKSAPVQHFLNGIPHAMTDLTVTKIFTAKDV